MLNGHLRSLFVPNKVGVLKIKSSSFSLSRIKKLDGDFLYYQTLSLVFP